MIAAGRAGGAPSLRRGGSSLGAASGSAALTLVVVMLVACGCGESQASHPGRPLILLVQAPPGGGPAPESGADFRDPCPSGSRVAVWDPARPEEPARILSDGFEAAGAPAVTPDGSVVLFSGRRRSGEPWRIYTIPLGGGAATAVSPEGANATAAAFLPGGRIVFSCDLEGKRDPRDGKAAYSLYTCGSDGSDRARITFNPSSDIDPTVLDDGRILYVAWQPPGSGRPRGGWALFTVRDDGTGIFPFHGSHQAYRSLRHPRQAGERVLFAARDGGEGGDTLRSVLLSRPLHSIERIAPAAVGTRLSAVEWGTGKLLLSGISLPADAGGGGSLGLYRAAIAGGSPPEPVLDDAALDELDAVIAIERKPPKGHLSMVNPKAERGELLCLDARLSGGSVAAGRDPGGAAELLLYQAIPPGLDEPFPGEGEGAGASFPLPVPSKLIATVPLAGDGSAYFEAPADTPIRFRSVNARGETILDARAWVWVRPGERRSCIGCHEDRELAPPNRVPEALSWDAPIPVGTGVEGGQR